MSMPVTVLRTAALCYYLIFGGTGDAIIITALILWRRGPLILRSLEGTRLEAIVWNLAIGAGTLASLRYVWRRSRKADPSTWDGPGRPLLFPCQTTHTRLFPKKHSFSYSYLLVGIPVDWKGVAGGMISNDAHHGVKGWYNIDPADYLARGDGQLGLRGKLDAYLESQGVDSSRYPFAYLATAARFLGYHFNPVSFWYLYSAQKSLAAIILEVNNTFDERRMYYLTIDDDTTESIQRLDNDGSADNTQARQAEQSKPLRQTWPKDFHVSPFNSRKGAYSLTAYDPLFPNMEGRCPINSTINLISSKGHAKLVARIFSDGDAIDPVEMTLLQKFKFLASWWWVGFVTFPRIVKEAGLLFFKRKLHVWYRPEPLKSSIGRQADKTETLLEPLFRKYLKHLVEQSPEPLIVQYIPSGIAGASAVTMMSSPAQKDPGLAKEMEFKVLTPAFYSRFVFYAHDLEAIFCELSENNTICVSKRELLPRLFVKKQPPPLLQTASYTDYGYFSAIKNLRQRPERIERPLTSSQTGTTTHSQQDIRGFRLSSMDGYVLSHEDGKAKQVYRESVLRLFVAEKVAMGSVDILQLEHWILRLLVAWVAVS
ncbi:hypothetical protein GGR54DRAFT_606206 [Hypoxylon sp. NC1633]|nr:hypothetical protein GGR54DRAFT_606206 [Hypoxylon sp. NC1633]